MKTLPASLSLIATAVVQVTAMRNGFELFVQEPINVRAVLLRDEDGAWSLDTVDAIDGVFVSDRFVTDETGESALDPQEHACCEEATAQRWAIETLRQALTLPRIERVA